MQFQTFDFVKAAASPEAGRSEKANAFGKTSTFGKVSGETSPDTGDKGMALDKLPSKTTARNATQGDTFASYLRGQSGPTRGLPGDGVPAKDLKVLDVGKAETEGGSAPHISVSEDASVSGDAADQGNAVMHPGEGALDTASVVAPGVGASRNGFATQTAIQQILVANGDPEAKALLTGDGTADMSSTDADASQGETPEDVSPETFQIPPEVLLNMGVPSEATPLKGQAKEDAGHTTELSIEADDVPGGVSLGHSETNTDQKILSPDERLTAMTRELGAGDRSGFSDAVREAENSLTAEQSATDAKEIVKDNLKDDQRVVLLQEQVTTMMGVATHMHASQLQEAEDDTASVARLDLPSKMQDVGVSRLFSVAPNGRSNGADATSPLAEAVDLTSRKAKVDMSQPDAQASTTSVKSSVNSLDATALSLGQFPAVSDGLPAETRPAGRANPLAPGGHSDLSPQQQASGLLANTTVTSVSSERKQAPQTPATEMSGAASLGDREDIIAPKVHRETTDALATSTARPQQSSAAPGISLISAEALMSSGPDRDQGLSIEELGPMSHMSSEADAMREQSSATSAMNRVEFPTRLASQIADVARQLPDRPVEITLSPQELGKVRLSFHLSENGAMQLVIAAERADTLDLMRRNVESLITEFRDLGYADSGFTFQNFDQGAQQGGSDVFAPPAGSSTTSDMTDPMPSAPPVRLSLGNESGMDLRL